VSRAIAIGIVDSSVHDVKEIEIVVTNHDGFDVVEIRIKSEKPNGTLRDDLVVKCFTNDKGFHVRKFSDSLVERLIQVKR